MRFTLNGLLRLGIGVMVIGFGALIWAKLQSLWNTSGDNAIETQSNKGQIKGTERPSFYERRRNLEHICANGTFESPWDSPNFIVDPKHNLAYCDVSKTGSTLWKAIFAISTGKVNVTSPTYLLRNHSAQVHNVNFNRFRNMSPQQQSVMLTDGIFLLFARDPYMRLLSAYMDKFVRPNAFYWREYGRAIVNFIRKTQAEQSRYCGHDVTFEEFIRFFLISQSPGKTFSVLDRHWTPIYQLCHPCTYPYSLIGKTEFMAEDTTEILEALDIDNVINFDTAPSVEDDIKRRVTQFFDEYLQVKNCTNLLQVVERFWLYLTAKGYFRPGTSLPLTLREIQNSSYSIDFFKTILYEKALSTYTEHKSQGSVETYRLKFASEAYSEVSDDNLMLLKVIVKKDCLLFGYSYEPDYIFSNRKYTSNGT